LSDLRSAQEPVQTGVPGLDEILLGGLPRHHVYLVEGTPGTGKTTLALQFLLAGVSKEEQGLYVALSETTTELNAVARSHGWDLRPISLFEITPVEGSIQPEEEYTVFHSDEVEMAQTIRVILDRVEEVGATRVVIDSLAELRLLSRDSIRYRRQVLALKQYFTHKQITVLLLDDRTSEKLDRQVHSLTHGVISLERLSREYGKNRRRLEVSKLRGTDYLEGYHDYVIQKGGLAVFPRLVSAHGDESLPKELVSSNMMGLDELLGGGLDRGSATLVLGPAGCGKTTLAMKYAMAAIGRAEPVAVYTFDEGLSSLLARGDALGMHLTEHLRQKKVTIQQVNPAELSPGDFAYQVRRSVEHDKAQIVIIDSLNGYLTAMPQEQYLSLQMHELLNYLNQHNVVTILILAQQGLLGSMQTSIDLSYLADNIILLRFFEAAGRVRRAISVVKKRNSQHEQTIREFTIGLPDAVQIGKPLTKFQGILSGLPQFIGDPESLSKTLE
jgi:circadian clock protein KaiC